jgi:hypothetical protein
MTHLVRRLSWLSCIILLGFILFAWPVQAEDSEVSRATLAGIQGIQVIVEELQPNVQKYAGKVGLNKAQMQRDVEARLREGGVPVVAGNDWMNVPGRPVLYVNVNTHETEKYWYAYDIKVELRQIVSLVANPKVKALADTWSLNMTGMANIGNLDNVKHGLMELVGKFMQAYRAVNKK